MTASSRAARALWSLLAISLGLRALVIAVLPTYQWFAGGDGPWYVQQGWRIAHAGLRVPLRTVGPVYPLVLALVWRAFPGHGYPQDALAVPGAYLTTIRLAQAATGTATAALVFALARALRVGPRASLAAAVGVGLGPAFVIEPFLLHTETVCLGLFTGAVLLHVRVSGAPTRAGLAGVGVLSMLAALTRPVLLLFPVVLALHLLLTHRRRRGARMAATLLAAAALTAVPWHLWLHRTTGSWLPEGFSSNLWIGAQGTGGPLDPATFHARESRLRASGRGYLDGAFQRISDEPGQWLLRRSRSLAAAVLQPHGTSDLGGPSMKAALARWVRDDRSLHGLRALASKPTAPLRALIYLFHYAGLALAAIGVWATRRDWRAWFPVVAAVLYVVLAHALLVVSPRYLFPVQPFVWVLAAAGAGYLAASRRRYTTASPANGTAATRSIST
jgi:hypothetical protein